MRKGGRRSAPKFGPFNFLRLDNKITRIGLATNEETMGIRSTKFFANCQAFKAVNFHCSYLASLFVLWREKNELFNNLSSYNTIR